MRTGEASLGWVRRMSPSVLSTNLPRRFGNPRRLSPNLFLAQPLATVHRLIGRGETKLKWSTVQKFCLSKTAFLRHGQWKCSGVVCNFGLEHLFKLEPFSAAVVCATIGCAKFDSLLSRVALGTVSHILVQ